MIERQTIRKLFGSAADREVVIIGTGPSVWGFDWAQLDPYYTIALNDAIYYLTPDIHLWHDNLLFNRIDKDGRSYIRHPYQPKTLIVCRDLACKWLASRLDWKFKDRVYVYKQHGPDSDVNGDQMWVDHSVSTAGIMLAKKLGARKVFLLGLDGFRVNGAEYAHELQPGKEEGEQETMLKRTRDSQDHDKVAHWLAIMAGPFPGGIINCSPHSIITTWPRMTWEAATRAPRLENSTA